jgi:L-lactate utilization protein LutB
LTTASKNEEGESMPSQLFYVMKLLEERHVHFFLAQTQKDAVTIFATMVGKRIEIYVDSDDNVDFSVFLGTDNVVVGVDALLKELNADQI